ncbi:hypothetical protein SMICM17S_06630 [Streptomyces microflavus]
MAEMQKPGHFLAEFSNTDVEYRERWPEPRWTLPYRGTNSVMSSHTWLRTGVEAA